MEDRRKAVYLLAGGRAFREQKKPDPFIQAALKESGVISPAVAYVGAASGDDTRFFSYIAGSLKECGAGDVVQSILVPEGADIKKARQVITRADVVFISGGDVEKGMQVLEARGMIKFFTEAFKAGKPFFGLSAGSIMLAQEWVRWRNPDDDSTAELFPCLGFAPVICDTHSEEDDWPELKAALMLKNKGAEGYGIVSGAGLKVNPDRKLEALGGGLHRFVRSTTGVERIRDLSPG